MVGMCAAMGIDCRGSYSRGDVMEKHAPINVNRTCLGDGDPNSTVWEDGQLSGDRNCEATWDSHGNANSDSRDIETQVYSGVRSTVRYGGVDLSGTAELPDPGGQQQGLYADSLVHSLPGLTPLSYERDPYVHDPTSGAGDDLSAYQRRGGR